MTSDQQQSLPLFLLPQMEGHCRSLLEMWHSVPIDGITSPSRNDSKNDMTDQLQRRMYEMQSEREMLVLNALSRAFTTYSQAAMSQSNHEPGKVSIPPKVLPKILIFTCLAGLKRMGQSMTAHVRDNQSIIILELLDAIFLRFGQDSVIYPQSLLAPQERDSFLPLSLYQECLTALPLLASLGYIVSPASGPSSTATSTVSSPPYSAATKSSNRHSSHSRPYCNPPSEELMLACSKCTHALICCISESDQMNPSHPKCVARPEYHYVMAHHISVMLDIIADQRYPKLVFCTLRNLELCTRILSRSDQGLVSFLPGIVSCLAKMVVNPAATKQHSFIIQGLNILTIVIPDGLIKMTGVSASSSTKNAAEKAALSIHTVILNLLPLRHSPHPDVRLALCSLYLALITTCHEPLNASVPCLVEGLLYFLPDSDLTVAAKAKTSVETLKRSQAESGNSFLDNLFNQMVRSRLSSSASMFCSTSGSEGVLGHKKVEHLAILNGLLDMVPSSISCISLPDLLPWFSFESLGSPIDSKAHLTNETGKTNVSYDTWNVISLRGALDKSVQSYQYDKPLAFFSGDESMTHIQSFLGRMSQHPTLASDALVAVISCKDTNSLSAAFILNAMMTEMANSHLNAASSSKSAVLGKKVIREYCKILGMVTLESTDLVNVNTDLKDEILPDVAKKVSRRQQSLNVLKKNLMIEGLARASQLCGRKTPMFELLFVLLQFCCPGTSSGSGSGSSVSASAITALCQIAQTTGYDHPQALLNANLDYLVNAISNRIHEWTNETALSSSSRLVNVIITTIEIGGPDVLVYLSDSIEDLLDAIDLAYSFAYDSSNAISTSSTADITTQSVSRLHDGEDVLIRLFSVFNVLFKAINESKGCADMPPSKRFPILCPETLAKELDLATSVASSLSLGSICGPSNSLYDGCSQEVVRFHLKFSKSLPSMVHPNASPPSSPIPADSMNADQDDSTNINPSEESQNITPPDSLVVKEFTQEMTLNIMKKALSFLSCQSPQLKKEILIILRTGIYFLHPKDVLPMVHLIWTPLLYRLRDPYHYVVLEALEGISTLAHLSRDFIVQRTREQLLPPLYQLLSSIHAEIKIATRSKEGVTSHDLFRPHSIVSKVLLAVLHTLTSLIQKGAIQRRQATLPLLEHLFPLLNETLYPKIIQRHAVPVFEALAKRDMDAVWLFAIAMAGPCVSSESEFQRIPSWIIRKLDSGRIHRKEYASNAVIVLSTCSLGKA